MTTKPRILMQGTFPEAFKAAMAARFDLVAHDPAISPAQAKGWDKTIRGLVSWARLAVTREMMDRLPGLEIVAGFGVGYDRFDLAAAKEKRIIVTNTPDVLTDDVADLAIGLMIAASRRIATLDRFVRAGRWAAGEVPAMSRKVTGKRLGIAGLGRIGRAIAQRAAAFDMQISYTGPRAYPDVSHRFVPDLVSLARDSDFLVIACRAEPETRHMVNAEVLAALGAKGVLVNIARGSMVDEAALLAALKGGTLGGVGLDVFADEPRAPAELFAFDNVVLTPHVASATVETRTAMGDLVIANLESHFAGKGPLTPVQ